MKSKNLAAWINRIMNTRQQEISCTDCFDLVSVYVDEEISGKASDQMWDSLRHHLDQCLACREEYEILRDLANEDEQAE